VRIKLIFIYKTHQQSGVAINSQTGIDNLHAEMLHSYGLLTMNQYINLFDQSKNE